MVTRTPESVRSTFSNGLPVLNAMPRLRKARSSALELCSSSGGSSRGSASTIVTSTPKDFQALANSQPITPPPRTIAEAGHVVEVERVLGGDHPLAVDLQAGQGSGVRAGGQDQVRPGDPLAVDLHRGRADQPALALDQGHLVELEEALQPPVQPGDHTILVGVDALHVDPGEGRLYSELLALAGLVGDLAGVQQRLGRDAAPVQAGAADLVLLDQRDRQPEFGGPEGRRVAAAAAAQNDDVVTIVRCVHGDSQVHGCEGRKELATRPGKGYGALAILSLPTADPVTRCAMTRPFGVPFPATDGFSH